VPRTADLPFASRPIQLLDTVEEARDELPGVVRYVRHLVLEGELRIAVSAPDSARAESALAAALTTADSVAFLLGSDNDTSEIARVNRGAGIEPVSVGPWTEEVIAASLAWAERTGGAFDPTIAPVARLWGFGQGEQGVPREDDLESAMGLVGWDEVELDLEAHTVYLPREGMALDLRAVAKGFALDRMHEAMIAAGATGGVADLDGNLRFFGPGTGTTADRWSATVSDPYAPSLAYARLEVPPGALATSASLKRTIEIEGRRYGHLIDPRTGMPVGGLAAVTVYAPDALTADALSTALYVLGPGEGVDLVRRIEGVEAIFVIEGPAGTRAEVVATPGFEPHVRSVVPPLRPVMPEDS